MLADPSSDTDNRSSPSPAGTPVFKGSESATPDASNRVVIRVVVGRRDGTAGINSDLREVEEVKWRGSWIVDRQRLRSWCSVRFKDLEVRLSRLGAEGIDDDIRFPSDHKEVTCR